MTQQERALLAAVLWLATQTLHGGGTAPGAATASAIAAGEQFAVRVEGALPSIKEQFEQAFTPGTLAFGREIEATINIVGGG